MHPRLVDMFTDKPHKNVMHEHAPSENTPVFHDDQDVVVVIVVVVIVLFLCISLLFVCV